MLSVDKHCEMLTNHICDRHNLIMEGFKLYVQMFSAIVGGTVALRLQFGDEIPRAFATLADALAVLIFVASALITLENLRGWYGYRETLTKVAGTDEAGAPIVPAPHLLKAGRVATGMIVAMAVAWIAFYAFNPLRISN
jgi:hypothetical protein